MQLWESRRPSGVVDGGQVRPLDLTSPAAGRPGRAAPGPRVAGAGRENILPWPELAPILIC
jgi:hypothetical protein